MSITMDIEATQEMKDVLAGLKSANGVDEMMGAVFTGIHEFCEAIDDTTTTVVFSFGHDLTEHEAVAAQKRATPHTGSARTAASCSRMLQEQKQQHLKKQWSVHSDTFGEKRRTHGQETSTSVQQPESADVMKAMSRR